MGQKITYDIIQGLDFSVHESCKWRRADDARYPDDETDGILRDFIDTELKKKGLVRTEGNEADVYMIYQLALIDYVEWSPFNSRIGWPAGQSALSGFPGATTNSADLTGTGRLIVDLYDVKQKKQVWQAVGTKTPGKGNYLNKKRRNAGKLMSKIYTNFPPPNK